MGVGEAAGWVLLLAFRIGVSRTGILVKSKVMVRFGCVGTDCCCLR